MNKPLPTLLCVFLLCIFTNALSTPPPATSNCGLGEDGQNLLAGKAIVLKGVYFDFFWDILPAKSQVALDKLVCFMKNNPNTVIAVSSYDDENTAECYYVDLGHSRQATLINYLKLSGIDTSRIMSQGFQLKDKKLSSTKIGKRVNNSINVPLYENIDYTEKQQTQWLVEIELVSNDYQTQPEEKEANYCGKKLEGALKKPTVVENIFYDLGRWDLRPESKTALDELVCYLNDNAKFVIEIGVHTDSRRSDSYSLSLSQKRAQSITDYLIENGIDPERLVAKGYEDSKPYVISHDFSFFKKGDVLDDRFINQFDKNDPRFEEAHQLNRRVEIAVLRIDYMPRVKPEPKPKPVKYCDGYFEYNDTNFCVGEIHRTKNIYNDLGPCWSLSPPEPHTQVLDSLYNFLVSNPDVKIEVGTHTDTKASEAYNLTLSRKRAESIVDYLVEKGISPSRLTAVGYGEGVPYVVPNDFSFFKRGDILNDAFIKQFQPDDPRYEEAHQMNRRIEIKITGVSYTIKTTPKSYRGCTKHL